MLNTVPFPHHATFIEQNVLQMFEKMFSKFYSNVPQCRRRKQYVLHVLNLCIRPYLTCIQKACTVLYYHLFHV